MGGMVDFAAIRAAIEVLWRKNGKI